MAGGGAPAVASSALVTGVAAEAAALAAVAVAATSPGAVPGAPALFFWVRGQGERG